MSCAIIFFKRRNVKSVLTNNFPGTCYTGMGTIHVNDIRVSVRIIRRANTNSISCIRSPQPYSMGSSFELGGDCLRDRLRRSGQSSAMPKTFPAIESTFVLRIPHTSLDHDVRRCSHGIPCSFTKRHHDYFHFRLRFSFLFRILRSNNFIRSPSRRITRHFPSPQKESQVTGRSSWKSGN